MTIMGDGYAPERYSCTSEQYGTGGHICADWGCGKDCPSQSHRQSSSTATEGTHDDRY